VPGDKATAVIFPFDLFGSSGSGEGAKLLGDALREMLADNRRESVPTRSTAYQSKLRVREVPFDTLDDLGDWRKKGRSLARQALKQGEFVLWLSGNHLGVLPVYEELGPEATVVQFDAHLDVYHLHDCEIELSHGNFLLHSSTPLPRIVQVGHRDLFLAPEYRDSHFAECFAADEVHSHTDRVEAGLAKLRGRVWIDIDCDVFDPAFFPAVNQRQPFGLSPAQVLRLASAVRKADVVGVSVSEFDPARDRDDQSLATLVWLLEWALLRRFEA